jgi:hypothetical protein
MVADAEVNNMYNLVIPKQMWTGQAGEAAVPSLARLFYRLDAEAVIEVVDDDCTPNCILSMLACHPDVKVRSALARQAKTPSSIFLRLALDEAPEVRYELAENHNVPLSVLLILAEDGNAYVRARATWTIARLETNLLTVVCRD